MWKRQVQTWSGLWIGCTKLCERTFCWLFRKKRSQSTLLDPKLMFWCVSRDFDNGKMAETNMVRVVHRMHGTMWTNILEIFSQRTCSIHLIRHKIHLLMRFARFWQCENGRYKHGSGCAPDARNYVNELFVDFFRNKLAQSTLLDPKLMFWCVSRNFDNGKMAETNFVRVVHRRHKTVPMNFWEILSQRTCQIHLIRPKTYVLMCFARFRQWENGGDKHGRGCAPDTRHYVNEYSRDFFAANMLNPPC